MLIVIIGPDGSGKTTIAKKLKLNFNETGFKADLFSMNFQILPKLRDLINPFLKKKIINTNVEGQLHIGMKNKPNSRFRGMFIATWYALDFMLGKIKLSLFIRKFHIIIFARYFYDYYFQRGHLNTPKWYLNILQVLVPVPDFIFTIKRNPAYIYSEKPELTIIEIERQQNIIDLLLSDKENAFIIDGNKGVEDTMDQIMKIINTKW